MQALQVGEWARQRRREPSLATLPTASPTFAAVIVGTAILVGALTFLPALALGLLVEQLTARCGSRLAPPPADRAEHSATTHGRENGPIYRSESVRLRNI